MKGGAPVDQLVERFKVEVAPALVPRLRSADPISFVRLRSNDQAPNLTVLTPHENAYSMHMHMRDLDITRLLVKKADQNIRRAATGSLFLFDLEEAPTAHLDKPFDIVRLHVSKASIRTFAEENDLRWSGHFRMIDWGTFDPILYHLASCLIPSFEAPAQLNSLFLDQITLAFLTHALTKFGDVSTTERAARGGLAPWQLRRVRESLEALDGNDLSLSALAQECDLSPGYFARAFRHSMGQSPYRYQLERRIELAKDLMVQSRLSLSEIAVACGFADQSHLTKTFSRIVGVTPGAWRREKS